MYTISAYKCEHCMKRYSSDKKAIKKHEMICFYNPLTKSCITCINLTTERAVPPNENYNVSACALGIEFEFLMPTMTKMLTNCSRWEPKPEVLDTMIDNNYVHPSQIQDEASKNGFAEDFPF